MKTVKSFSLEGSIQSSVDQRLAWFGKGDILQRCIGYSGGSDIPKWISSRRVNDRSSSLIDDAVGTTHLLW